MTEKTCIRIKVICVNVIAGVLGCIGILCLIGAFVVGDWLAFMSGVALVSVAGGMIEM